MDGLEEKSILDGKKAIIAKVFPDMRMDGKSAVYIDAMYDLAVNEAGKRKDVNYQKQQMTGGSAPQQRADSVGGSMAATARQRMIEKEKEVTSNGSTVRLRLQHPERRGRR